jgi:hypothetical protein
VNLCYDLHERRDKVIAACEALIPHLLNVVDGGADRTGQIPSIIWMHRGGVPFVSQRDFDDIYWATLKPIIQALWARGSQLVLYAEGNWDRHLSAIAELPEKSIIFHVDKTDLVRARDVLGSKFCLSGGVPLHLLSHGTPDEVRACCKWVIDTAARDGGYIMDASGLIMNDARVENVQAMVDFTLDYGTYSQTSLIPRRVEDLRPEQRGTLDGVPNPRQRRDPGVCVPWNDVRTDLPRIEGDETLARRAWERVDRLGYNFCWVCLTW